MPTSIDDAGVDGERLVVKGLKNGEFHVVSRWTPKAGEYRDICRLMLDLTGLELGQSTWPPPRPRSSARVWLALLPAVALLGCLLYAARARRLRKGVTDRRDGTDATGRE